MPTKIPKKFVIGLLILFAILFLIDRYYWAEISQWREDQATNIWLGFTRGISHIPVGLISSRKIPNPNGMPLLGFFLSALPNLLTVSFFLGAVQIVLLILVGWKVSEHHWQSFIFAAFPVLSSIALRSTSVEFWNQYMMTLLNIFFIFWAVRYLQNTSLWNLPPIAFLILLAPSLYLAGIVNAIVMSLLTLAMIVYKRPNLRQWWAVSIAILLLISISIFLTWLPYFHNISIQQLIQSSKLKADPVNSPPLAFEHEDLRILSLPTQILLNITNKLYSLQVVFAILVLLLALFYVFVRKNSFRNSYLLRNASLLSLVVLSGSFILLSYILSLWLGGANWFHSQRPDQTVQFVPMFLWFIFLLPFSVLGNGNIERITGILSVSLLTIFVTANLLGGFMIIRDHLQYRGNILTSADVPLTNKMQVVDFIARDWKSRSDSNIIPVDYRIGGGKWDWVPDFGRKLMKWYAAPMTMGRSFDFELLRRYGLRNQQEGKQRRKFGEGRYLVTYAFEDAPQIENGKITNYTFGRLRVSVIDK